MIHSIPASKWSQNFNSQEKQIALTALENGQLLFLPELSFALQPQEKAFLSPSALKGPSKNISYEQSSGIVKGTSYTDLKYQHFLNMMHRFVQHAQELIYNLFPSYQPHLCQGRTSYRPIEILGRINSKRKDDKLLHVDAFPATPNQGNRILRVFSNINPEGKDRVWNLGEPFQTVVNKFSHVFKKPFPGTREILSFLKVTKSYRSLYDHYMLQLHDSMKLNANYQQMVPKITHAFPPGSSWIVMTDSVSHAALSGQYVLEHTFYLPIHGMQDEKLSPLRILERKLQEPLSSYVYNT